MSKQSESGTTHPRGRPKTFDRERVIDVGIDSYWRDGTGVSLNDLCRRADVSKPGLYREFGGEDGLMDAVLDRYAETVLRPMLMLTEQDRPFPAVMASLIEELTSPDTSRPNGCLLARVRAATSETGPLTRKRVDALRTEARAAYARWVERGMKAGEIQATQPTSTIAAFIDAELTSLLNRMAAGEDPAELRSHAELAFSGLLRSPNTP